MARFSMARDCLQSMACHAGSRQKHGIKRQANRLHYVRGLRLEQLEDRTLLSISAGWQPTVSSAWFQDLVIDPVEDVPADAATSTSIMSSPATCEITWQGETVEAASNLLLKEHLNLSDETLEKLLEEMGLDTVDFLEESNQWFVTQDYMLSPGEYRLAVDNKVISATVEEMTKKNDKVFVEENNYPVTNLFGVDIYEVIHTPTHQKIYVTAGELNG